MRRKSNLAKSKILALSVSLSVVFLDQISKFVAPNFLAVSCNRGVAFGIGNLGPLPQILVLAIFGYLLTKEQRNRRLLAYGLIIGGGFANLIDRLAIGCVRDFIDLGFWPVLAWFPTFNLADAAITIGVMILIVTLIKREVEPPERSDLS